MGLLDDIFGSGGQPPTGPAAVDARGASSQFLFGEDVGTGGVTDPEFQRRIIEAEKEFRPEFAGVDLAVSRDFLLGPEGLINLQQQVREQGGSPIVAELEKQALADLQQGGQLSGGDLRQAQQGARQAGQARGRVFDVQTAFDELRSSESLSRMRRNQARQFAGGVDDLRARDVGSSLNLAQFGLKQGTGPELFDPNAGINLALSNEANSANFQSAIFGADQARRGATRGAAIGAVGSVLGGFF